MKSKHKIAEYKRRLGLRLHMCAYCGRETVGFSHYDLIKKQRVWLCASCSQYQGKQPGDT